MSSAKKDVLDELEHHHLTKVIGRKPTATDVDKWEDEAAEMATLIKSLTIPGGMEHGHLVENSLSRPLILGKYSSRQLTKT
jgi:hypothetical protein